MSQNLPIAPDRVTRPGRLKKAHIAVLSALLMATSGSYAASFGKLTVLSALGQPFRGEIELNSYQGDDDANLTVKLASVATYKKANIDLSAALLTMQFVLEQRGSRKIVKISSDQAVNDPYMDMLVELGGNKSRVVREYTVLLEPQGLRAPEPAPSQNPAISTRAIPMTAPTQSGQYQQLPQTAVRTTPSNRPLTASDPTVQEALALQRRRTGAGASPTPDYAPQPSVSRPSRASSASVSASPAPAATGSTSTSSGDGERLRSDTVARGETLRQVAGRNLSDGISLDQMLVALFRANQDSFTDKNMNMVRAGTVLTVPVASVVKEITPSDARREIQAQTKDFNSYRNALAAKVGSSDAAPAATAQQSGGGRIGATVKDNASANTAPADTLKLSRGNTTGNDSSVAGSAQGGAGKGNVKDLQQNVDDLKKVLEIQNQSMDKIQNQANGDKAAPATAAAPAVPVAKSGPAQSGGTSVSGQIAPADGGAVPPAQGNTSVAPVQSPAPGTAANSVSGTVAPAPGADGSAPAAPAANGAAAPVPGEVIPPAEPQPKQPLRPVAPVAQEKGFLSQNPMILPLGGAVVVLLGAIGFMRSRKKRKQSELFGSELGGESGTGQPLQTNSLFAATGGQDVDTKNSMFNSSFVPNLNNIDTNVDPVAEADVYIAYGRDAQAEEILKEALHSQPGRNGIRLKLLEIYAIRKDTRAFEVMAGELYSLTRGEGPDWAVAAGLGMKIDPDNPLYAGGNVPDQMVERADAITAPTQPMSDEDYSAAMRSGAQQQEHGHQYESESGYQQEDDLQYDNLGASTMPYEPSPGRAARQTEAPIFEPFNEDELSGKAAPDQSIDFHVDDNDELQRNQNTVFVHPDAQSRSESLDLHGSQEHAATDANHIDFDLGGTDGHEYGKPTTTHTPESTQADVSLNDEDLKAVAATQPAIPVLGEEAGLNPDIETKLDLASAYQEIGDLEGARELLMEIMRSGSPRYVSVAQEMLDKMN